MLMQPEIKLSQLRQAARNAGAFVVLSLEPGVEQTLARCLGMACAPSGGALARRLNSLGVNRVLFDEGYARAQTDAEAAALVHRMRLGANEPLLLASCPGWCNQANLKEMGLDGLFTVLPASARCRGLALRFMLAAQEGVPFSSILHVTVVGCAARKEHRLRCPADHCACIGGEYVITVRELKLWLGLDGGLMDMPDSPSPLAAPPKEGRLFDVLKQAARQHCGQRLSFIPLAPLRERSAVMAGELRLDDGHVLRYARLRGLHDARWLMAHIRAGEARYDVVEVFTCMRCG